MPAVITDQPPIVSPEASTLMLSAQMLAKRLAISVRTLWRLRSAGKIPPPIRLGGAVRWRTADIEAWVAAGCPNPPSRLPASVAKRLR